MKTSQCLLLLVAGMLGGFCVGGAVTAPNASAQVAQDKLPIQQRFQMAEWSNSGSPGETAGWGCYVLDTMTGELWHTRGELGLVKIHGKGPTP